MEHDAERDTCDWRTRILPREFHQVFHRRVLVRPGSVPGVRFDPVEAVLFQHWGDGDGFGEVEGRELQGEDREVDGGAEKEADLRFGFAAAVFTGVCR